MNELVRRLLNDIEHGQSRRQIADKIGVSEGTIRNLLKGKKVKVDVYEGLASKYFHVPVEEVYRMAGLLPSMYDNQGNFTREFLLARIWELLNRLPEDGQALALAEIIRISSKYEDKEGE